MLKLRGSREIMIGPAAEAAGTSAWPATLSSALQPAAFALRAVAKLLNALLNVVLAAATKILRAALRSGDAHAFRRDLPRPRR